MPDQLRDPNRSTTISIPPRRRPLSACALALATIIGVAPSGAQKYVAAGSQGWSQDSSGIEGTAESGDRFGAAVAIGDFNGDGTADVAIGAPDEDNGEGAVHFIFGTAASPPSGIGGLHSSGDMLFQQDEFLGDIVPHDVIGTGGGGFGQALAVGDFDGNGYDDLAIGVPYASSGSDVGHGEVNVLYSGFGAGPGWFNQLISQDLVRRSSGGLGDGDITGAEETGDGFGFALAAGDFNNDGYDDLAIGAPFEDSSGHTDNGAVNIIYGSSLGLHWVHSLDDQFWDLDSEGIKGVADDDAHYGWSLISGDFDGDGYDDLAIGIPEFDVDDKSEAGAVSVMYGSSSGITDRDQLWHLDVVLVDGVKGVADGANFLDVGDGFGYSLAAGDFDADGYDDLAIGSPKYEVSFCGVECPDGAINVLFGTTSELTDFGDLQFFGGTSSVGNQRFGLGVSLAAGDFNDDGYDDLVAGAPDSAFSGTYDWTGGRVVVYLSNGHILVESATLNPESLSGGSSSDDGGQFGTGLALGDLNGDGADDLVGGAPGRNSDRGIAHAVYGARDTDRDGVSEVYSPLDNCLLVYNPGQADWDNDGRGDACDVLTGVSVSGPAFCQGYETIQLTATATWSDGDVRNVTSSATWSLNSTQHSNISSSGALYCDVVFTLTGTTARASYSQGATREGTHNVSIQPRPISYEVVGPNAVDEGTNTQYRVDGTLLNGSVVNWSSHVTWSENREFTSISSAGVLNAGAVATDQVVRISAQDPNVQDPFILDVTVRDVPTLTGLEITGFAEVPETSTAQYTATAQWSNGTTTDVTAAANWSENSEFSTISGTGMLSTTAVNADQSIQISATYSDPARGGAPTQSDTFDVTILDVPPVLTGLEISGPTSVAEGDDQQYTATALWSDGSTSDVTASAQWTEDSPFISVSATGLLTAVAVDAHETATLHASFSHTARGSTTVDDSFEVTILDVPPELVGIAISGPTTVVESTEVQYTATALWSDGSTADVTAQAQWQEDTEFTAFSAPGALVVDEVPAGLEITITASYDNNIVFVDDSMTVTAEAVEDVIFLDGFESGNTLQWGPAAR